MNNKGKAGCGCLLIILVVCVVLIGLLVHPVSLKTITKKLRYEDKIDRADIVFVHRFEEDKDGELYSEAFHQYKIGNARAIYVEEDLTFGVSIELAIAKLAAIRGIKESAVKAIDASGEGMAKLGKFDEKFRQIGCKKVIVVVPEYGSKRYRTFYDSIQKQSNITYMIDPVQVTYFARDRWWKDSKSRLLVLKELYQRVVGDVRSPEPQEDKEKERK